jgi:hypothetical protein
MILVGHFLTSLGIDFEVANPMAGLIDLIETDCLGLRGGWEQCDRARHQRQPQEPFQLGRGALLRNSTYTEYRQYKRIRVDVDS